MKSYRYTVVVERDPPTGNYGVIVPALPGCFAVGKTADEAMEMARGAIALHIEGMLADGEEIPDDVSQVRVDTVEVTVAA